MSNNTNKVNEILNSLWVILSFIPLINGLGFVYIGSKTENRWFHEGILYEIPWIIMLPAMFLKNMGLIGFLAIIGLISIITSIIRSFKIRSNYIDLLKYKRHRSTNKKIVSLVWTITTAIPLLNGVAFIYYGDELSKKKLIFEGIIYEIPWFLALINPLFIGIGFGILLISLMSFIQFNYTENTLSHTTGEENTSTVKKTSYKQEEKKEEEKKLRKNFEKYKKEISRLKEDFDKKEEKIKQIIKERFESSTITYNRFMDVVNKTHENFYGQKDAALEIINGMAESDAVVEKEIQHKISNLKAINEKINDLTLELIVKNGKDNMDEDLQILVEDMDDLIKSVKNYKMG